jgi:hypothetical protein
MSALNAVKAKLINRVFATVNRGTEYKAIREEMESVKSKQLS